MRLRLSHAVVLVTGTVFSPGGSDLDVLRVTPSVAVAPPHGKA